MLKKYFTLLVFIAISAMMFAQNNIIDEVIWIVGDEAIFKSEVEEYKLRSQYEGNTIEGDPDCVIPEQLAIQKLYLHQATLDSIIVSEKDITMQVENRLNYFMSRTGGSKEKLEEYFNKSIKTLREEMRDVIRDQLTINEMQSSLVKDIKSTPADIRRYFNSLPSDSVPMVPAQVELQILSYEPAVSPEETERVKERLREYSEQVNSGKEEFSLLARVYSEDIESAKRGGELGFLGRGQLVPEYASVAFNLQDPKKVSRVVESEFGYHIIQLIERRGDRVNTRHILLKPRVSSEDRKKATTRLDSISDLIRGDKITFEKAVMYFSQDKNTNMNAGLMQNEKTITSKFEYQDLPGEVSKIVYNMNVGEISKPFSMIDEKTNKEVVAIVKLKSKVENHKANLNDDYQLLKMYYEDYKRDEFIKNWIAQKQKETYISIDPAWSNCDFQYKGWIKN